MVDYRDVQLAEVIQEVKEGAARLVKEGAAQLAAAVCLSLSVSLFLCLSVSLSLCLSVSLSLCLSLSLSLPLFLSLSLSPSLSSELISRPHPAVPFGLRRLVARAALVSCSMRRTALCPVNLFPAPFSGPAACCV